MSLRASLLASIVVGASGCAPPQEPRVIEGAVAAPARDLAASDCRDVGDVRACWGGLCPSGCVVASAAADRSLPHGLRCSGTGAGRSCVARSHGAGAFRCQGDTCRQAYPRTPDAGEWECVDLRGAYLCRSVSEAAGIPRGPRDPAFGCGARRGTGEPICVDFAPDLPDGAGPFTCSMRVGRGLPERHCSRAASPVLGARCKLASDCPEGARCSTGHCLPAPPHPDCWFDKDCSDGQRCRFGSCA